MYITKLRSISPQFTFNDALFGGEVKVHEGNKFLAIEPDYSDLIRANQLRRMGKSIRMGIGAGLPLLKDEENVNGILLGSSEGGLEDCIKFLNQIVDYKEGPLTPTNFVQSTPNALAGNLALMTQNSSYNITHVHKGLAFENTLLDAFMLFEEQKASKLLLGNVEEVSDYNFNVETLAGQFKKETVTSTTLLDSQTKGTVCGEGSVMFVVESDSDNYLAKIADVNHTSNLQDDELLTMVSEFLSKNNLTEEEIDAVILGCNGDSRTDTYYWSVQENFFSKTTLLSYKNLVGDYPSSSAFACYLAVQVISGKDIPQDIVRQGELKNSKNILIYNHYKGTQHSLILIQA